MKDWTVVRTRYLQDELPVRLGGLAANLMRIKSFSMHESSRSVVESLMEESKWFIEWTAGAAGIETAAVLGELQVQLALWQLELPKIWLDEEKREELAAEAGAWSGRVLGESGLLAGG